MLPHVICHMVVSLDGRTLSSRWRPGGLDLRTPYENLHKQLGGDAWLIGRITGSEFAKGTGYPEQTDQKLPREPWFAVRTAGNFAVVIDATGKIAWGRSDIDGDPIVVILTEQVSDAHLAGLRRDGVSYLFAGKETLDLAAALESLNRELGVKRILLEGGGGINGSFLRAGLVDEISLLVAPAVDGRHGAPVVFDGDANDSVPPIRTMKLEHNETLEGGLIWLRYRLEPTAMREGT